MHPIIRSRTLAFLLLLTLVAAGCMPSRGRGNNNGGGNNSGDDDDAAGDDDDAAGDDDDAAGDDDDAAGGALYYGDVYGGLKAEGGGDCYGNAEIRIDDDGMVVDGRLTCGEDCVISFSGPYAFSEEPFVPSFDCSVNGISVNASEFDAWIWGSEGQSTEGNVTAYGDAYFYVSFNAYLDAAM